MGLGRWSRPTSRLGGTDQTLQQPDRAGPCSAQRGPGSAVRAHPSAARGADGVEEDERSRWATTSASPSRPGSSSGSSCRMPDDPCARYCHARLCTAIASAREVDQDRTAGRGRRHARPTPPNAESPGRDRRPLPRGGRRGDGRRGSEFDAVFKDGALPADVLEHALPAGDSVHLPAVLTAAGLAESERGPSADRPRRGPRRRQAGSGRGVRPAGRRAGRLGGHGRQASSDPPAPSA